MLRRLFGLFGVELEKVGDDFGFGRVGHKAVGRHGASRGRALPFAAKMKAFPINAALTGEAAF